MATIYKRGKKWRGQETIGGIRASFTGATKKEVQISIANAISEYERSHCMVDKNIATDEWIRMWLKRRANKLSPQTYEALEASFENHLIPYVGKYKLCDLNKGLIEEAYARAFFKKRDKKYSDDSYAHATVNALAVQFKKCLQYAVDTDILPRNPHNGVELHKLRPPKKIVAYSRDEQSKIIEYVSDCKPGKQIYYILIATGMRIGEVCALTWDDVDLKNKSISINKTAVSYHGSMMVQDHPKTVNSNRTIYLPDKVVKYFRKIWKQQDQECNYYNLVAPTSRYTIQSPSNLRKYWKRICTELNIPYRGLHSLRHTWATRALEAGMDVKTVSDMLGHKNVITTMNIYQDALEDHKREEIKKINEMY